MVLEVFFTWLCRHCHEFIEIYNGWEFVKSALLIVSQGKHVGFEFHSSSFYLTFSVLLIKELNESPFLKVVV